MRPIPIEYIIDRINDLERFKTEENGGGTLWYISRINTLKELLEDWEEENESNTNT